MSRLQRDAEASMSSLKDELGRAIGDAEQRLQRMQDKQVDDTDRRVAEAKRESDAASADAKQTEQRLQEAADKAKEELQRLLTSQLDRIGELTRSACTAQSRRAQASFTAAQKRGEDEKAWGKQAV